MSANEPSVAERARRGVAVITFAKVWFLLTGFAQPVLLTRALGKANYGVYGAVLSAVSILNNVVVAGSIQAMSKSVTTYGAPAIRRGLVLHALLGAITSFGFAALSGPIGAGLLKDPGLPPLLRVASIVTGMYCVYAALVGSLNGTQRFVAQAALDIVFATLRTALIVGLAWMGLGVHGAISGFAAASVAITALALVVVAPTLRNPQRSTEAALPSSGDFAKEYAGFFAPVLLYQLALNFVLQADVLVMQAILAREAGATIDAVKELIGAYKSVQNFAFLPYQLLIAVTFVLFPVVSKAAAAGDLETTRTMLRGALRFAFVLLGVMLAVIAGVPEAVLRVVYRPEFLVGAGALRWLALGQGAFALAVIGLTVVLASKRVAAATLLMVLMLALVFVGDIVALGVTGFSERALSAAAIGTASGTTLGMIIVFAYVLRLYGPVVPWSSALRASIVGLVAGFAGSMVPAASKVSALGASAVAAVVFVVGIVLSGEFTATERKNLMNRLSKRR